MSDVLKAIEARERRTRGEPEMKEPASRRAKTTTVEPVVGPEVEPEPAAPDDA
jgi:hypothetical protein